MGPIMNLEPLTVQIKQ